MYIGTILGIRDRIESTCPYVLLKPVYKDSGELFRDHCWVKWSKRFLDFSIGDTIKFTAKEYNYISSDGDRIGLKHIRYITLHPQG